MSLFAGGLSAAAGLNNTLGHGFAVLDRKLALANKVRPDMSPAELYALSQEDKALSLQLAKDDTNQKVYDAMLEADATRQQKERERRQRLQQLGVFA